MNEWPPNILAVATFVGAAAASNDMQSRFSQSLQTEPFALVVSIVASAYPAFVAPKGGSITRKTAS